VFAAFAPVATRMRPAVGPTVPKPIFHIAGVEDPLADIVDQQKAVNRAKAINGHTGKRSSCGSGCEIYGRDGDTPVMFWVHSGGHVYPADTPGLIARFFRGYPLKR
jgi:polyhydroxybutyrate depolymerase